MIKNISLLLILGFIATTASADTHWADYGGTPSMEETSSTFVGLAIGGVAGGPPGAIVGAAIGALFGEGWMAKKNVGNLQADLIASRMRNNVLRDETESLQREFLIAQQEINRMRTTTKIIPATLAVSPIEPCCDNTVLSMHFRSGSSEIEDNYAEQLASMIRLVEKMPTSSVEIIGYADRNGDATRNLELSRQRTNVVKQYFNRMGVKNSAITTLAYGESKPLQMIQSYETDFFDRRVIVRLIDSSQQMFSQTLEMPLEGL
ncbi:MAG TPA: hypothetical protein EYG31_10515 [Porticoccaceae bacterium]|jgi:outer membrane protein OmpA-like peptidoglycan-associated protein|nr:hypothetical protein [Gammaproteobacteria bacterium]HIL61058.1 hypothetical protein [Porticoccaceae bacterium]